MSGVLWVWDDVVGKLAAVWPLLGIVLEAVVLCVIIVVHERKRARQRALADTDADNDSKDAAATNRLQVISLSMPRTAALITRNSLSMPRTAALITRNCS